jgi:hypothetical protein
MQSFKLSVLDAFIDLRARGFARPAAEKFGGAWLACFLVMARGNVLAAFSFEHAFLALVCGIVSAAVAVSLLAQMDRTIDSASRQATISAIATFIGDVFAHPSTSPRNGRSRRSRPWYPEALPSPSGAPSGGRRVSERTDGSKTFPRFASSREHRAHTSVDVGFGLEAAKINSASRQRMSALL